MYIRDKCYELKFKKDLAKYQKAGNFAFIISTESSVSYLSL